MRTKNIVISLDRRPDRYQDFKSIFLREHYKFSGFDGKILFESGLKNEINLRLINKFEQSRCCPKSHVPGVLGCWRSHLGVWYKLYHDMEVDSYLIMEDDLKITENFFEVLDSVTEALPKTFDICYLGGRFKPNFNIKQKNKWKSLTLSNRLVVYMADSNSYGHEFDRGLFCYILTKNGAKKLLDYFFNDLFSSENHIGAVDEWIYKNRNRYELCEVLPHVSWSVPGVMSDIR